MARSAYCPTCKRTVYVELEDSLVCPVCSSPIIEAVEAEPDVGTAAESSGSSTE